LAALARLGLRPQLGRRARVSAIGVEFADEQLNLVQLQHPDRPLIRAFASVPYPVERAELMSSAAAVKGFIRQALKSAPFSGRKAVAVLPAADVRILSVVYQPKPNETDSHAIAKLMTERIGEDLAQFVIDYVPIRSESVANDRRAMVLITERRSVVAFLDLLRNAGLDVEALEVSPVAIKRLVSTLIDARKAPQNVLVVNTGADKTFLTMVSGQRLLFDQEVAFGEQSLLDQLAIALDVNHDVAREIAFRQGIDPSRRTRALPKGVEDTATTNMVLTIVRPYLSELVAEIGRAAMFASSETRGTAIGQAYLLGSIARWPGAAELLAELTDLPVAIPQPLPLAQEIADGDTDSARPDLVIAAGLALRGFSEHA
jgi:type IV pilus assembly protein PilM